MTIIVVSIKIIMYWLLVGLLGWIIGTASDKIFRKNIPVEGLLFCVIMEPMTVCIAMYCLTREIIFKVKGWLSNGW